MNEFRIIISGILISMTLVSFGQMGVNTTNPDSSSVLELKSIRRGFLLPRMNTSQRRAISAPANGLFVYDTDDKMFYFYDSTYVTPSYGWTGLTPWIFKDDRSNKDINTGLFMRDMYTHSSVRSIGVGTISPNSNNALTVSNNVAIGNSSIEAPEKGLFVEGQLKTNANLDVADTMRASVLEGHGTIPLGGIIMWSGSLTNVPDGWELCDGNSGVVVNGIVIPDLQGRFIVGAGVKKIITRNQNGAYSEGTNHTYVVGTKGGADDVKVSVNEMPSHNHGGKTGEGGEHKHDFTDRYRNKTEVNGSNFNDQGAAGLNESDQETELAGKHTHIINAEGGNAGHENRPPYYVLAYIIRVK